MINCPVCKNEFEEKTGRRPKRFCSDPCKVKFWNDQKSQNKPQEEKSANDVEKEIEAPVESENNPQGGSTILDELAKYEAELPTVPDSGLGKQRRKWLQNKIYELKKQLS